MNWKVHRNMMSAFIASSITLKSFPSVVSTIKLPLFHTSASLQCKDAKKCLDASLTMPLLLSTAPYHLLMYSMIFGTTAFHSYISAPIAFKVLPRKEFGLLQNSIFPGYFLAQSITPVLIGLTAPYALTTGAYISLGVTSISGAINYFGLLPWTHRVKEKRFALEAKEGKDCREEPISPEMASLNKEFGKSHGLSLLLNMASFIGLTSYGFILTAGLLRTIPRI